MATSSSCNFYVAKKSDDEKSVWFYFNRDKSGNLAKCNKCYGEIKTNGGSTKGLHVHLRSKHDIDLLKKKPTNNETENTNLSTGGTTTDASMQQCQKPAKKIKISSYFIPENDRSLAATLARLVAVDGLSFSVICTSHDIRAGLMAMGHASIPTSANTIRQMICEYAKTLREIVKNKVAELKAKGQRFSVTFDEWTSLRNRRYMNVNVHSKGGQFWSLGLIRVEGSMPATSCIELVDNKLKSHGLCLKEDIVCITTDGASVMTKVGKLLAGVGPSQQLCFAHGLQLAVLDVLYQKRSNDTVEPAQVNIERSRPMFSLSVDVHEYDPDEVSVRSEDNYLIVEAKHNQTGSRATRDLCRRTKLPNGIDPTKLSSTLSAEGLLTIHNDCETGDASVCMVSTECDDHINSSISSDDDDDNYEHDGLDVEQHQPDQSEQCSSIVIEYSTVIQKVTKNILQVMIYITNSFYLAFYNQTR